MRSPFIVLYDKKWIMVDTTAYFYVILFFKVQRRLCVVLMKRLETFSWTLKLVMSLRPRSSHGQSPTKKSLNPAGSPSRPLEDSMSDLCGFCHLFNPVSWEFKSTIEVGYSVWIHTIWFVGKTSPPRSTPKYNPKGSVNRLHKNVQMRFIQNCTQFIKS